MKKKNIIFCLVDSTYSECIGDKKTKITTTPYIDSLIQDGIYINNVFSFGPYTDAATKGLYTGAPTLDNYGFFFNYNFEKSNHFRVFKENGYETISLYYPYFLIGSNVSKYIDYRVFTSGFLFESVWNGKYRYYSERYKNRLLTKKEYDLLYLFTEMLFDCWKDFYGSINSLSEVIIKKIKVKNDINHTGVLGLEKEIEKYKNNKTEYINSILENGMKHELAHINDYDFTNIVDRDTIDYIAKKHRVFIIKLFFKNLFLNVKNGELEITKVLKRIILSKKDFCIKRYLCNCLLLASSTALMNRRARNGKWQLGPSALTQVNSLIEVLKNRKSDKPFFATLHFEEPHHNINFFSYDIKNKVQTDKEMLIAEDLLSKIGDDYYGNIMYQLSLRYVDCCIETLFKELKGINILDDTVFVLSADHGSSYTFETIRDSVTNNFYDENYHVPLLIWDKDNNKKGAHYSGYYSAKDVFPTVFDYMYIKKPSSFKGESVFSMPNGREIIFYEYTGPGVPDMLTKQIWISARNHRYQVSYIVNIGEGFCPKRPDAVFDLINDPKQINNLREKQFNREIMDLISTIERRYKTIVNNNQDFLRDINSLSIQLQESEK